MTQHDKARLEGICSFYGWLGFSIKIIVFGALLQIFITDVGIKYYLAGSFCLFLLAEDAVNLKRSFNESWKAYRG